MSFNRLPSTLKFTFWDWEGTSFVICNCSPNNKKIIFYIAAYCSITGVYRASKKPQSLTTLNDWRESIAWSWCKKKIPRLPDGEIQYWKKLVLLNETRPSIHKIQIATFIPLQLGTIKCKSKAGNHFLFLIIQASFCKLPLSHALPFMYNILTVYVGFNVQPSMFTTCSTVKDKPLKWCDISGWTAEPSFS